MKDLERSIIDWHVETFPNATEEAVIEKIAEELSEFICVVNGGSRIDAPEYLDELADVFITHAVYLHRYKGISISDAVRRKLNICKGRSWGAETSNGDRPRVKS